MGAPAGRAGTLGPSRSWNDQVFADEPAAVAEAAKQPRDDAAAIAYLKEQQWTNEFATALVREAERADVDPRAGHRSMLCRAARRSSPRLRPDDFALMHCPTWAIG